MSAHLDRVLSEFMDAWSAGRRPDVDEYLARVPEEQRGELADQLTTFLALAPTPAYDEATYAAIRAEPVVQEMIAALDEPAGLWRALLPRARTRAEMSLEELAGALTRSLGIEGREEKAAGYLRRMEEGELEPSGVSRRVLDALASALHLRREDLEAAGDFARGPWRSAAFFRADADAAQELGRHLEVLADAMAEPAAEPWDEVDELFRGGR